MNVYEIVTQNLIERIEREGVLPWEKPWTTSAPKNLKSGKEYRGLNIFLLSSSGFPRPEYLTYRQAEAMGANVRKGEHGQIITYWKRWPRETESEKRQGPKAFPFEVLSRL
jgi:antirestriction protein ArdC